MNSSNFDVLINELKKNGHSDDKVMTVRATLAATYRISSKQVADILGTLSFDSTKLEVAKMAYPYAIDKGNYAATVGAALTFSSGKNELSEFIQNCMYY